MTQKNKYMNIDQIPKFIDPLVDYVFKAILGSNLHKRLLISFLNAILEPNSDEKIKEVTIKNPFVHRDRIIGKECIVDVKAEDEKGRIFQIEVQRGIEPHLNERVLYTWASNYQDQIKKGEDYVKLKPCISIWLFEGALMKKLKDYHLKFEMYNEKFKTALTNQCQIHLLQLGYFKPEDLKNWKSKWLYFFKEGKKMQHVHQLPKELQNPTIEEAWEILEEFKEKENYAAYLSRMDKLRARSTLETTLKMAQEELKLSKQREQEERKAKEKERKAKEEALKIKEKERKAKEEALKIKEKERKAKEEALKIKEKERKAKEEALKELNELKKKINLH